MISQDLQALIPKFLKTTRIIWMAFLGAPVIYSVLAWIVTQGGTKEMASALPAEAVYVLYLIAAASGVVFPWVIAPMIAGPKRLIAQGGSTALVTDFGANQARYERLGETEKKKAQYLGAIQSSFIVRWAGAESVAIYGILGMMTGLLSMYGAWAFSVAAMILLGFLKPDYEAALEQLEV